MRRLFVYCLVFLTISALVGGVGLGLIYVRLTGPGPLAQGTTLAIPRGAGSEAIAQQLSQAGIVADRTLFSLAARIAARQEPLKAGEYRFSARISSIDAIRLLQSGKTVIRRLTVAEGLTTRQIVRQLLATEGLDGSIDPIPAEGSLLPETYHFSYGDQRQAIVERMQRAMRDALAALWADRSVGPVIKTPEQAVVLASVVEKETGIPTERPRIAAVFLNRLAAGMRLQSDPTVVYVVGGGLPLGRALTRADLQMPSPYNTYLTDGLPPTPIANPGRAALSAVMRPASSEEFYFVADGTGGHVFARTLEEHNRNVQRWRKLRREKDAGNGG